MSVSTLALALVCALCASGVGVARAQSCSTHQRTMHMIETDCSAKGFERVPTSGDRMILLTTTHLIFDDNRLLSLNENSLLGLANLTAASFARNRIRFAMSGTFAWTPQLETLNLTSNELSHLYPDTFARLVRLVSLDLSRNQFAFVNETSFAHLPRLATLLLSHNRLHTVHPYAFRHLSALKTLALDDNQLVSLPGDVDLSPFPLSLASVRLGRNPWRCDCRLYWLRYRQQWQGSERTDAVVIVDKQQMLCANEASDAVVPFLQKDLQRFGCRPTIYSPPGASVNENATFVESDARVVSARLGAEVELRCDVYSRPRALENITWRRRASQKVLWRGAELKWADAEEQRDGRLSFRIVGSNNFSLMLRIENLEPDDAGGYECETANSYGRAVGRFELHVAAHVVTASTWGDLLTTQALVFVVAAVLALVALLVLASVLFCFKSASQRHASRVARERRKLLPADGRNGDGPQQRHHQSSSIGASHSATNGPSSVASAAASRPPSGPGVAAADTPDSPTSSKLEALANHSVVLLSPPNGSPQKQQPPQQQPQRLPLYAPQQAAVLPLDHEMVASAIGVHVDEHCPVHGRYAWPFGVPGVGESPQAACGGGGGAAAAFDLPVLYAAAARPPAFHNPTCPLHGAGSKLALVPISPQPTHLCCVDSVGASAHYSAALRSSYSTLPRQPQQPLRRPFSDEQSLEAAAAAAAMSQDKSSPVFVPREAFEMASGCTPNRLNAATAAATTNRNTMLLQGVSLDLNVDDAFDCQPMSAQTLSDNNTNDSLPLNLPLPLPEPLPPPILPSGGCSTRETAAAAIAMRTNGPMFSSATVSATRQSILSSSVPRRTSATTIATAAACAESQSSFDKEFPPPPPLPPLATTSGAQVVKTVRWTEDTVQLANGQPVAPSNGSCA